MNSLFKISLPFLFLLLPMNTQKLANKAGAANLLFCSAERNFTDWSESLFHEINEPDLDIAVLKTALKGYLKLIDNEHIDNKDIISIIDFSKSSKIERLFIIDIKNKKLLFKELVAHGTKTGVEYAKYFSNKRYSNQSSLGFYVTGKTYKGSNGFSLKLHGQEKDFNSNAYVRGVVMHGAKYVSQKFVKQNGRLGRSFGCPAVPADKNEAIINTIKNGTCFFIYYPDKSYLEQSELVM